MRALKPGVEAGVSRKALTAFLLVAAYAITDWTSLALGGKGHVPPFWLCNAFVAALVVLYRDERWRLTRLLLAAWVCSLPAFLYFSPSTPFALVRTILNLGEGVATGLLAVRVLGPRLLLRTAPQRGLWATCAFSASNAARDAGVALVGAEAAGAEAAAVSRSERTEGGLSALMAGQFKKCADLVAQCGSGSSLSSVEFAVDALLPFVRVTHLMADQGNGPMGTLDRNQLRRLLVANFGDAVDVFRHYCCCWPDARMLGGEGAGDGEGDGGDSTSRPVNCGVNGGPLGMTLDVR